MRRRRRLGVCRSSALRGPRSSAISVGIASRSARRPCASRARRPSAAGSRRDTICPGRNAGSRPARSARAGGGSGRRRAPRLVGPTAAVFHSGASKSSIETKVGSPPMVRRTSCASRSRSTCSPSASSSRPGFVGERRGDARRLADARRPHVEAELDLGAARPRRRSARPSDNAAWRRAADVAFAAEQARGRVEADPAGAGQIDLGPGVQIGEIVVRALRPVERIDVGPELDQIAGDEARGEAEMAQDLHQQPGGVAAGAGAAAPASPPASGRRAPCGSRSGSSAAAAR